VRAAALALLVAFAWAAHPACARAAAPREAPGDDLERRREAIARELLRVGAAIRGEIERGDVAALVARVPRDGLRCGGRVVPRARVARDLAAPGSWLHGVLFGGPGHVPGPRTLPSLASLFRSGREVAIVVSFQRDRRAGPAGLPCVEFRARDVGTPGTPLCFEERGGRWWLTESLYPCG
jgi:hypothetical protein